MNTLELVSPAASGRIGPNAITRVAEVLTALVGHAKTRQLFEDAGIPGYLREPPQQMVDELEVASLDDYVARFGLKTHVNDPSTTPAWRGVPADKLDAKRASMRAHASQIGPDHFMSSMPDEAFAFVFGDEWFIVDDLPNDPPAIFTEYFLPIHD